MKVLALGAGVQSTTILLMACKGDLPKPDVAIFADTGWERTNTYKHLNWLRAEAERHGIPVLVVQSGKIPDEILNAMELNKRFVTIPFHGIWNGKKVILRRQCTENYKIKPIQQKVRELLGIQRGQRLPRDEVELWLGISTDEANRVSAYKKRTHMPKYYPLIQEVLMSRRNCTEWLNANYPQIHVPRSACVGCPFQCNREWKEVKANREDWQRAVSFDNAVREIERRGKIKAVLYLHRSLQPLEALDLSLPEDRGQLSFGFYKTGRQVKFINLDDEEQRSEAER